MQHMQLQDPILHKTNCTQLVVAYNIMYANSIYGMNLYFIHLYYFTRVAHGDMWHLNIILIFIIIINLIISMPCNKM